MLQLGVACQRVIRTAGSGEGDEPLTVRVEQREGVNGRSNVSVNDIQQTLHRMSRLALLSLLLLATVNLAFVQCSKSNITAAKLKRCSACQIFVQELHDQMLKSADTKETILLQAILQRSALDAMSQCR